MPEPHIVSKPSGHGWCRNCNRSELLHDKHGLCPFGGRTFQDVGHARDLSCCVCGNGTRGRQWWNRDTGYGICTDCIAYVRKIGETEDQIRDYYGIEGVHWGIKEENA